ncbi:MAG: hypothetical protein JNM09_16190 [Blastocatellia bacterium]|nr:hypothetical protein [Blastocatellia bacterium]
MKKTFTTLTMVALIFTLSAIAWGQKTARQRKAGKLGKVEAQNKTQGQRLAVLPFRHKGNNQWWHHGGAEAMQDVFVTELVKSGKFTVVEREQLQAGLKQNNLVLSGDVDPSTAVKVGKLLGVNYLLTGSVTEYGNTDARGKTRKGKLGINVATQLIDTSTGEIVWADEVRSETPRNVSVGGFGGGVDDNRLYNNLIKDSAQQVGTRLAQAAPTTRSR